MHASEGQAGGQKRLTGRKRMTAKGGGHGNLNSSPCPAGGSHDRSLYRLARNNIRHLTCCGRFFGHLHSTLCPPRVDPSGPTAQLTQEGSNQSRNTHATHTESQGSWMRCVPLTRSLLPAYGRTMYSYWHGQRRAYHKRSRWWRYSVIHNRRVRAVKAIQIASKRRRCRSDMPRHTVARIHLGHRRCRMRSRRRHRVRPRRISEHFMDHGSVVPPVSVGGVQSERFEPARGGATASGRHVHAEMAQCSTSDRTLLLVYLACKWGP